ncbi:Hypothetical predicted protein [Pelobates cultripes]|uniref:Uncharacterized protein n=1 Tax=Pelobates cultripes TaxID=61616 RepID=A0AAD1SZ94_PELCU|nr:Hypothetical predicted protein [Pelobates cultripes]
MVSDLKAFFTSELAVLKEKLGTLTGQIRATEDEVHDLRVKQDSTTKQVLEISTTCEQLNARVGQLEDSSCQRNLKVRGIPETISVEELPQFIRRLFSAILPPKQDKGL